MTGISATITVDTTILKAGATSTVEITFNEAASGFDAGDLILPGGSISNLTSADGGINWAATYTPQAGIQSAANLISLNLSSVTDPGGHAGANLQVDSNNFIVDGVAPFIDGITVQNTNLFAGQTTPVTFHFSEFVNGFDLSQVTVGDGTLSNLTTTNNITWTATLTPTDGFIDHGLTLTANPVVTDFAGNSGGGSATSNAYDSDTVRPRAVVDVITSQTLDTTHTATVAVGFTEAVSGLTTAAFSGDGTFSNLHTTDGVNYSATFTPGMGFQSNSEHVSVDLGQVSSVANGNAGAGTATSGAFGIDTLGPTSTVTVGSGVAGLAPAPVTVTFSEPVTGFTDGLVHASNGTLSSFTTTDGQTFTGTFTATPGVFTGSDPITVNDTGVQDAHGNAGVGTTSSTFAIDTFPPTVGLLRVSDTAPHAGEIVQVQVQFSEALPSLSLSAFSAPHGTLSGLQDVAGGAVWLFNLTPDPDTVASGDAISLDMTQVFDAAGNPGVGTSLSNTYNVNTLRPTATLSLTPSPASTTNHPTLNIDFNEPVNNLNLGAINAPNGAFSNLQTADNQHFTATFSPNIGVNAGPEVATLTLGNVSAIGSANQGVGSVTSSPFQIDTQAPNVSISVPGEVGIAPATVTVHFSEAVTGFSNAAVTVQFGNLSTFTTVNNQDFTATYTAIPNVFQTGREIFIDASQVHDLAGNPGLGNPHSNDYTVDTQPPTATLTLGTNHLGAGQTTTVTFAFSEPVADLGPGKIGLHDATISGLATADGGVTWTATLAPSPTTDDPNAGVALDLSFIHDAAGNAGSGVVSHTFDAEGVAPTATVSLSQNSLIVGQTATVTVTTNEPVNPAFTVVADHATVGAFTQTGADTYQATLTPNAGETSAHNLVTVSNLADLVGNTAAGTFTSGDYAVDTLAPSVVSQTVTGATVHASQTAQLVTTFSEAVANFGAANQSTDHGTLGTPTTSDGGVTWTTVFTPDAGAHAAAHTALVLTGLTDLAGNPIGGAGEAYPTIQEQTVLPSATISLDQTSLHPGDTMGVTVAFNQAVTGFDNTDLGLQGGTLSPVQTSDGGTTWHATFTAGNTLGASDHISLNLAGVTDADGNAGVGSDLSPGFDVIAAASPPPPPPPPTPDPTPSQPTDSGPETMTGSQGADTLSGGTDSDMVSGGGGDDSMSGQAGADTLAGGDGGDFLQGNVGTDSVNGGAGDDKVYGGQGDDQVQGGPGADFVSGDKGDDVVRGGQGDDVVSGGDGNDFISGDLGSDTMTGGAGADTFHSFAGAGLDVVTDFNLAEGDRVELDPGTTFTSAQVGADTVITLSGPGGAGELVLQGVQLSSLHGDWIFVG